MWKAIDKIGIFLENIFTALKFAAFDYDFKLQQTKTTKERIFIWSGLFILVVGGGYLLLLLLANLLRNYVYSRLMK